MRVFLCSTVPITARAFVPVVTQEYSVKLRSICVSRRSTIVLTVSVGHALILVLAWPVARVQVVSLDFDVIPAYRMVLVHLALACTANADPSTRPIAICASAIRVTLVNVVRPRSIRALLGPAKTVVFASQVWVTINASVHQVTLASTVKFSSINAHPWCVTTMEHASIDRPYLRLLYVNVLRCSLVLSANLTLDHVPHNRVEI